MNDSVQVDDYLAADPIDVVAAFTAQRPCHRRKRTRIRLVTVVFVSADVAILAKGASRGTARAGSARPLLAAMTRLRGSPATLQEISALGDRARPRAPLPLTW